MADVVEDYGRASGWTLSRLEGAIDQPDAPTPCEGWSVRDLASHVIETMRYFSASARGEQASPPSPSPTGELGDDPVGEFEQLRSELLALYSQPEVLERTGPAVGIALADSLLHGWDLARATGQDDTMPDGLAAVAYDQIQGRFTEEQRVGVFAPALPTAADAGDQERLLAYTGRAA